MMMIIHLLMMRSPTSSLGRFDSAVHLVARRERGSLYCVPNIGRYSERTYYDLLFLGIYCTKSAFPRSVPSPCADPTAADGCRPCSAPPPAPPPHPSAPAAPAVPVAADTADAAGARTADGGKGGAVGRPPPPSSVRPPCAPQLSAASGRFPCPAPPLSPLSDLSAPSVRLRPLTCGVPGRLAGGLSRSSGSTSCKTRQTRHQETCEDAPNPRRESKLCTIETGDVRHKSTMH